VEKTDLKSGDLDSSSDSASYVVHPQRQLSLPHFTLYPVSLLNERHNRFSDGL